MRRRLNAGLFLCTCRTPVPRTRCTAPPRSARRRNVFAANSEPGRRRPTGRRLPALGHGDQALALGQFPGSLARATDGFRLLAGLALGRLFIRLATLHLTNNALPLHLLLEHPESLIDVVVANEYLQKFSNRVVGAPMRAVQRSTCFEVLRRLLAAVADHFIFDRLTLVEGGQAGALDRGDVDEYIFAAALGLNESIALRRVEPLHGASSHHGLLVCTNLIAPARPSCDRSSEVSVAYDKGTPRGARQTRPLEYRDGTRLSQGVQPHDVIETKD